MAISERRQLITAKVETTYGTDAVPTAANNAVVVRSVTVNPLEAEYVERTLARNVKGNFKQIMTKKWVSLEIVVDLTGAPALGVPIAGLDALYRACGLASLVTAGTSVQYDPVSSGEESATVYFYQDGLLHKVTGLVGSMSLSAPNEQIPSVTFNCMGLFNLPTDVNLPAPTYTDVEPKTIGPENTSAFSLHSYTQACLALFEFQQNNEIVLRSRPNCGVRMLIVDRAPSGRVQFEKTKMATKDWFTPILNSTEGAFSLTHGPAGNRIVFSGGKAQLTNPQHQVADKIVDLAMDLRFMPGTGDDDFRLVLQ